MYRLFFVCLILCVLLNSPDFAQGKSRPFPSVLIGADGRMVRGKKLAYQGDSLNIKINHDTTTQVQNEEQICIDPTDPNSLVAVWRDFRLGYRRVGCGLSIDGGQSWFDYLFPQIGGYTYHSDPGLTVDRQGNFYAVILSFESADQPNGLFVLKSSDGGVSWSAPATVVDSVAGAFEDKELIACDRTGGPYDGNLYVTWTRFEDGLSVTHPMLSRSTDGGQSFSPPIEVSYEQGVQWTVPAVGPDGDLFVGWVNYNPLEIRLNQSEDGGVSFGFSRTIAQVSFFPGDINGGIYVFPCPAMDVDISNSPYRGNIYVAWMDYGEGGRDTDIFFSSSSDQGWIWSPPIRINDDSLNNGCDQFHPWLTVDQEGVISILFYDRRNDPVNNLLMDVYLAQSADGGKTFSPNQRVTTVSSDPTAGSYKGGLLGEYIGLSSYHGLLHPIWTDTREGNQNVYTATIEGVSLPQIRVYPQSLDFGQVQMDSLASLNLVVKNLGRVDLIIYGMSNENPGFQPQFSPSDSLISPEDSLLVEVDFRPQDTVVYEDTLRIESNGWPVKIPLLGNGVPTGIKEHFTGNLLPRSFHSEAYPNPFNSATLISYDLAEPAQVSLRIYNLLGQLVTTLVKQREEPGEHEVVWNAEGLPSGVYLCRISTGERRESAKLMLLR